MNKQDRFIVFLSLSFIFIVLMARYSFFTIRPVGLFPSEEKKEWRIKEEEAREIITGQKEVKEFLDRGEIRKEDEFGIIISQPKLTLENTPSEEKPFWEFHLFEEVINIPKNKAEVPSSHQATVNWYRIDAETGKIEKTF